MANIKSAEKRNRQSEKQRSRNRAVKSRLRSEIKSTRAALQEGSTEKELTPVLTVAYSRIDKAAKKGVIKRNTADRYKSRLTKAAKKAADTKA